MFNEIVPSLILRSRYSNGVTIVFYHQINVIMSSHCSILYRLFCCILHKVLIVYFEICWIIINLPHHYLFIFPIQECCSVIWNKELWLLVLLLYRVIEKQERFQRNLRNTRRLLLLVLTNEVLATECTSHQLFSSTYMLAPIRVSYFLLQIDKRATSRSVYSLVYRQKKER